jgi:hypothetical protein
MLKTVLRDNIGKFGMICAGETRFKKTIHGRIKEVDAAGNVCFVDNEDLMHIFTLKQVDSFEPKEFVIIKEKPQDVMATKKKAPKKTKTENTFKVFFTENDKEDYFIVEGETTQKAYATAKDVLTQRGLEYEKNKVYSQRIR